MAKMQTVKSLMELKNLALTDPRYRQLIKLAAANLGGEDTDDVNKNHRWLVLNANETAEQRGGGEAGVLREVNALRSMVKDAPPAAPAAPSGPKFPQVHVQLTGNDGNAFAVLGATKKAMKKAGVAQDAIDAYYTEATAGDYNHLLQVTMKHVVVS